MNIRNATTHSSEKTGRQHLLLSTLGSEIVYLYLARLAPGNGWHDVTLFLGSMALLFAFYFLSFRIAERRGTTRSDAGIIVGAALLFRLTLVPAGLPADISVWSIPSLLARDLAGEEVVFETHLLYDDDHWRCLWDGHVSAHGFDPSALPPADDRLAPLADPAERVLNDGSSVWSEIRDSVNHPGLTTIYPPAAQLFFRVIHAIAPGSVVAWKLALIGCDLLTVLLISRTLTALGASQALLILYAWNPLVIKVIGGSAHFDALVALAVSVMIYGVVVRQRGLIAAGWAAAVAIKLVPVVFVAAVVRRIGSRWSLAAAGFIAAMFWPAIRAREYGSSDGASAFASTWEFNAGFFQLLKTALQWTAAPALSARLTVAAIAVIGMLYAARRDRGDAGGFAVAALLPLAVMLLAGPVFMPWYLVWGLPIAAVTRKMFWFYLSAIVNLSFLVMVDGRERPLILFIEFTLISALIGLQARTLQKHREQDNRELT